jgi:SOS response regulatory protein OraA/RecX
MSSRKRKKKESDETEDVENKLKVVYSDKDVVVMTAPNEEELKQILLDLLSEKPMNLKELHSKLSGIASEDKIRRALASLTEKGQVTLLEDGRYAKLGTE